MVTQLGLSIVLHNIYISILKLLLYPLLLFNVQLMRHLKRLLFGIILLSSFGSAFADEYDPKLDVFDQIINTLVPLIIIFLFKESEKEDLNDSTKIHEEQVNANQQMRHEIDTMKAQIREMERILAFMKGDSYVEKQDDDVEKRHDDVKNQDDGVENQDGDVEKQEEITLRKSTFDKFRRVFDKTRRVFIKIRRGLSFVKIRRAFDDFLFLFSLFVLPSIMFHKDHERFATPLWILIFSGTTAGVVFILIIINYIAWHIRDDKNSYIIMLSEIIIDLCHIFSDICFLFYTRSLPVGNFTNVFIYLHAVTGILGASFLLYLIVGVIVILSNVCCIKSSKIDKIAGKYLITMNFYLYTCSNWNLRRDFLSYFIILYQ
jgi:hypothetical protein